MYEGLVNDLLDAAKVDKGTSTSKLLERAAEAIERLEERVAIMSAVSNQMKQQNVPQVARLVMILNVKQRRRCLRVMFLKHSAIQSV